MGAQTGEGHGHDRPLVAAASQLLDLGVAAGRAYGRDDLATRLDASRSRLEDPDLALMVVGEFKQGKSTLVNALLNVDVCPVDDDIATAVPTVVRHGEAPSAHALFQPPDDRPEGTGDARAEPIALDAVPGYVTASVDVGARSLRSVEVTVPRRLLASGLAIVDTPGVGGLASEHGAAAIGSLPAAEAVLFVTDASQELTRPELDFLRRACGLCPHVAVVVTKIDLYPQWRRIVELDRGHLADAGIDVAVMAISSALRARAVRTGERDLNAESGYPTVLTWLKEAVLAQADVVAARAAAHDVAGVCDQLRVHLEAERRALADPEAAGALVADLERAEGRARDLQSGAARWQTELGDGIQDLTSDVDHDLRQRFRDVNAAADERIDDAEPLDIWDELDPWLRQATMDAVAANHAFLVERAEALSSEIARLFAQDEAALGVTATVASPLAAVEAVGVDAGPDPSGKVTIGGTALGVLRGGYGGMLMFGMLAGMAGITLATPATLAVGLVMGRRHQRDEQRRQLTQRRQQAKQICRKYTDAVSFTAGKQSRDTMRHVHRELRDRWAERAQELQRSAQEALHAAEQAARVATADRDQRLADLDAELERVAELRARAERLLGGSER